LHLRCMSGSRGCAVTFEIGIDDHADWLYFFLAAYVLRILTAPVRSAALPAGRRMFQPSLNHNTSQSMPCLFAKRLFRPGAMLHEA